MAAEGVISMLTDSNLLLMLAWIAALAAAFVLSFPEDTSRPRRVRQQHKPDVRR